MKQTANQFDARGQRSAHWLTGLRSAKGESHMKLTNGSWKAFMMHSVLCITLAVGLSQAASRPITSGSKGKVTGTIVSRNGELLKVREKSGDLVTVALTDATKIERKKGKVEFFRHSDMDVTAMLPGLTITAEGTGNAKSQLEAAKVTFTPDEFAIEVAQEQQITANKNAAQAAQNTANQGVAAADKAQASANQAGAAAGRAQSSANQAQSSANQAQSSANQAGSTARAAGLVGVMDANAIQMVNQRVSDLDDYKLVVEAAIFFPTGKYDLDDAAKADLDMVAKSAMSTEGYMIEIAGYASSTGTKAENQKLSAERAAAVTQYLREKGNVPMRRILAPAGYGSTHPAAPNTDAEGREVNRRVDVKVIVNKGLNETI
jgi:outer membrane protein OmpA-like peptidoglycan-associated protein